MLETNIAFSIESKTNSNTKQPFGSKYGGVFKLRRPSIQDRNMADIKKAAILSAYGTADPALLGDWTKTSTYIYALVSTIATEQLPEWFDLTKLFDENDEEAIMAVWEEVGKFLDSFRPKTDSGAGEQGSKEP